MKHGKYHSFDWAALCDYWENYLHFASVIACSDLLYRIGYLICRGFLCSEKWKSYAFIDEKRVCKPDDKGHQDYESDRKRKVSRYGCFFPSPVVVRSYENWG